ncbi:MAG: O-antigen ligase family protein [Bacteroidales bacterium]|nr:O-antigen ligase family protein [Bacteroidales bacterium]
MIGTNIPLKISYNWLNKLGFFIILFYLNIGFIETSRLLEKNNLVICGILLFTLISFIIFIKKYKDFSPAFLRIIFIALLLYIYLIISSLYGNKEYGFIKSYYGLLLPFTIAVFFECVKWKEEEVLSFLTVSIFIISIIGILFKLKHGFYSRPVNFGLFGSITFGWMTGIGFFSALFSKKNNFFRIFFIVFFLFMLLWSGSKGPFLGVVLIFLVYLGRNYIKKANLKILLLFLFFIVLLYCIYLLDIRQLRFISKLIENPIGYLSGEGSGSIGVRIDLSSIAFKSFIDSPIIGNGFGSFIENSTYLHKYPHNVYLELLSETGILGLSAIIVIIVLLSKRNTITLIAYYGLIVLLFSGDFSYFRYALFILLMSYFIVKNKEK